MYETLHQLIAPYYLYFKFLHIPFSIMWAMSVVVAYLYYLIPAVQSWRTDENDPERVRFRNWVLERFDHGVVIEHYSFPIVLITGILMIISGGWGPEAKWLVLKLSMVIVIVIPMEMCDYYISHFGGNKRAVREKTLKTSDKEDWEGYETAIHHHWWFFQGSLAPVLFGWSFIVFLAVTKPF